MGERQKLSPADSETVKKIVSELQDMEGALLPVLHGVQDAIGYIPPECVEVIAEGLNLSRAEVHGVVSFYHHFRSDPCGQHVVQICRAESCQAMGSRQLEQHARQSLGIDFHETSKDGGITLLPVYCLGNCACSPAVRIGDDIYGHVDSEAFDRLVAGLSSEQVVGN